MENGIRIMQLQGSDIIKNNLEGVYIKKTYKAVFPNSLVLDKLVSKNIKINKNDSSRDIISVKFDFGWDCKEIMDSKKEIKELAKKREKIDKNTPTYDELTEQMKSLAKDIKNIISEYGDSKHLDKDRMRTKLYKDGFKLDFFKQNKKTKEYEIESTIEYVFWFRTSSKSRVGDVFFINKKLIDIREWQRMGINNTNKVVELLAYEGLTASSIEDRVKINPRQILVIDDVDSVFNCRVKSIVNDNNKEIVIIDKENGEVKNTLFDGQMLLDSDYYKDGINFMLLRHHMFKACAFNTNIKQFMMDWCKDNNKDYNTYTVQDRYNNTIFVKDIVAITTENAMKWEKFYDNKKEGYEHWISCVNADDNNFGVAKVNHKSKYSQYQRMSYQMINSLPLSNIDLQNMLVDTIDFINSINSKDDYTEYIKYLNVSKNVKNPNQMMVDLYNINNNILKQSTFSTKRSDIIQKLKKYVKEGKVFVKGDNLTIVGNPYFMLLKSVERDVQIDVTLAEVENYESISCSTNLFADDEKLVGFRSPHNSPNNIALFTNTKNELLDKYFNFGNNVMAVNLIHTNFQDLANGSDQDSDFMLVTNNKYIFDRVKECIFNKEQYPVIKNDVCQDPNTYSNTLEDYSKIDNKLAKAKFAIGESSNLAQIALSWYWDTPNNKENSQIKQELLNNVCKLSVLAQIAIDNAKRQYVVNIGKSINAIRKSECMLKETLNTACEKVSSYSFKPSFWKAVNSNIDQNKLIDCKCPMSLLQKLNIKTKDNRDKNKPKIEDIVKEIEGKANEKQYLKIVDLVKEYKNTMISYNDEKERQIEIEDLIDKVSNLKIKEKTMQMLIKKCLDRDAKDYGLTLLNILYNAHTELFLSIWK